MAKKRLLFMHIAKTAGSTVNAYFRQVLGNDRVVDHAEIHGPNMQAFVDSETFARARLISGHITGPELLTLMEQAGQRRRDFVFFTVVREPTDHLISHLRWVRGSLDRNEPNLPEAIARLAEDLSAIDLAEVDEVEAVLERHRPVSLTLFDNCQTRYFGQLQNFEVQTTDVWRSLIFAHDQFDYVINQQALERSLPRMCIENDIPHRMIPVPQENKQPFTSTDPLRSQEVKLRYARLVQKDLLLLNGLRQLRQYYA
ncbi:MAG: hypothetical protein V2I43_04100 [Parvularcula sp.]|jgi:hypothetical protein|nr:hypothetical protein [Parvularcula sp.]